VPTMLKKTLKNNFIILLKDYINWYQVKPFLLSFVNVLISSTRSTSLIAYIFLPFQVSSLFNLHFTRFFVTEIALNDLSGFTQISQSLSIYLYISSISYLIGISAILSLARIFHSFPVVD
jgi:hypothetical protein